MTMMIKKAFVVAALSIATAGFAPAAWAADITGAGATFPYPIYAKWAEAYKAKTGNGLNYQSIGRLIGSSNHYLFLLCRLLPTWHRWGMEK